MRTAVVLGAGGLTGHAFHVGVLRTLQELTGFDARTADVLVGTSAGSYVAASLAAGLSAADQCAGLLGEPLSPEGAALRSRAGSLGPLPPAAAPSRRPLDPWAVVRRPFRIRPGALAAGLLPPGRTSSSLLQRGAGALHGDTWPDRDLRICALRVRDGRRIAFGTPHAPVTDVGTAVAASCAIPGYYQPVVVDGQAYVDGGAHSPTNADVLTQDRLDLVLVLSPMTAGPKHGARADLAVRLAFRSYLAREVAAVRRTGAEVVVLQPSRLDLEAMGLNPMKGERGRDVVHSVTESVRARLEAQPSLACRLAETQR
jgi:NTE family protein